MCHLISLVSVSVLKCHKIARGIQLQDFFFISEHLEINLRLVQPVDSRMTKGRVLYLGRMLFYLQLFDVAVLVLLLFSFYTCVKILVLLYIR